MLDMSNMLMVLLIHTTKVSFLLKVFIALPHANGSRSGYTSNNFDEILVIDSPHY